VTIAVAHKKKMRGDGPKPHPRRKLSEEEFVAWVDEHTRAEWVDGEVTIMSPVSFRHNDLQTWLVAILRILCDIKDVGAVGGPEFFVRLDDKQRRVPDIYFLAKSRSKLIRPTYLDGAPDAIIEVVSPESVARDYREKYHDYAAAGVREYWIIDPASEVLEANALNAKATYRRIPKVRGKVVSAVVPGFYLRTDWLWRKPLPSVVDVAREFGLIA
jgi:Uma2 family endonuclease